MKHLYFVLLLTLYPYFGYGSDCEKGFEKLNKSYLVDQWDIKSNYQLEYLKRIEDEARHFATMDLSGKDYVDLILLGAQNKFSKWYMGSNHTVPLFIRLELLKSFKEKYKERFKDFYDVP